jgi:hypothetical protein
VAEGPRTRPLPSLLLGLAIVLGAIWYFARKPEPTAPAVEVTQVPEPAPPPTPPTPPAPAPLGSAPVAVPAPKAPVAELNEKLLMARLREVAKTDSAKAIALAEDGNRRFPDSADAPERESILIHALADAERRNEARGRAEFMVNHYPDSDWVREVEAFTGAHRHRNLSTTDGGQLIYVK